MIYIFRFIFKHYYKSHISFKLIRVRIVFKKIIIIIASSFFHYFRYYFYIIFYNFINKVSENCGFFL